MYQEDPTSKARVTHSHVISNSRLYGAIVHSAVFLGICVAAYTFAIMQYLHMPYDPLILVTAFLASYAQRMVPLGQPTMTKVFPEREVRVREVRAEGEI